MGGAQGLMLPFKEMTEHSYPTFFASDKALWSIAVKGGRDDCFGLRWMLVTIHTSCGCDVDSLGRFP